MIRRELISRLIDLETRYAAAVQAKRDKVDAPLGHARQHAVGVAAVALHGEPKIEEPLRFARSRMEEKLDQGICSGSERVGGCVKVEKMRKNCILPFMSSYPLSPFHV